MQHGRQLKFFKNSRAEHGGELRKRRAGRGARPLAVKSSMHLVLRSSKATGTWSFKRSKNEAKIHEILEKFSQRYGVKVYSLANVGNHLHLQIKLANRQLYTPFIRAISSAIAMAVTGASRWQPKSERSEEKFWDYRPFTRIVISQRAFLTLRDYVQINQWEGCGYRRETARWIVASGHRKLLNTG